MDQFVLWLSSINGFNGLTGYKLINALGNAKTVYHAPKSVLSDYLAPHALESFLKAKDNIHPSEILENMHAKGISFVSYQDKTFPHKLIDIPDPPLGLFYIGTLPSSCTPTVGIIGARDCSDYGAYEAKEIGSFLGKNGIQVVSGMARGIDGISQRAAIDAGGASFGVLGSGPDVCYPRHNIDIYNDIQSCGGIISLHPPGEPALPYNFPPRNRIVSGLSDAIIVVEARQKSGTLITVDMALEQGREVYAVPGRITDKLSDGCNGLIGQGASVFLSPEIFLTELIDLLDNNKTDKSKLHRNFINSDKCVPLLSKEQSTVYNFLDYTPKSLDEICECLGPDYNISEVMMILMQLVIDGHVSQRSQGYFSRRQ